MNYFMKNIMNIVIKNNYFNYVESESLVSNEISFPKYVCTSPIARFVWSKLEFP